MFEIEQTHFWFEGKRAFIAAMLNSLPKRSRAILDIGSGTGATTAFLSSWGHVTGLEYSPQARKLAKQKGIHLVAGSANKLPFANRSFDLVTYCDVLYHKGIDEHRALTHAYRVLKPGGFLLITDCAIPWLTSLHDVAMEAKYRYTKPQLKASIEHAGFTVQRCDYIFMTIFPLFVLSRLLGASSSITPPPNTINTILTAILRIEADLPRWIPRPIGSSLLVLAQKSKGNSTP